MVGNHERKETEMTAMTATYTDEQLHNAVDTINYWYDRILSEDEKVSDEASDAYERVLDYYSRKLNVSEAWLEDLATDTRYIGWDMC